MQALQQLVERDLMKLGRPTAARVIRRRPTTTQNKGSLLAAALSSGLTGSRTPDTNSVADNYLGTGHHLGQRFVTTETMETLIIIVFVTVLLVVILFAKRGRSPRDSGSDGGGWFPFGDSGDSGHHHSHHDGGSHGGFDGAATGEIVVAGMAAAVTNINHVYSGTYWSN